LEQGVVTTAKRYGGKKIKNRKKRNQGSRLMQPGPKGERPRRWSEQTIMGGKGEDLANKKEPKSKQKKRISMKGGKPVGTMCRGVGEKTTGGPNAGKIKKAPPAMKSSTLWWETKEAGGRV